MADFDPDSFIQSASSQPEVGSQQPDPGMSQSPGGFDPDAFIDQSTQEKYGTGAEQLKAGLEGASRGVLGPIATAIETKQFGVKPEDMLAREKANPITSGIGEAAGLGAGMLTGTGEAAVMSKAGELAAGAAGLGKLAEGASFGAKVGSEAVKQMAEMAVLQGSDETSKMILKDPETSAQSALTNIGLASALGGVGGAFVGAVNPLWEATAGPHVNEFLTNLKNHIDGGSKLMLPEDLEIAKNTLGIEVDPVVRAAISGDPKAAMMFNELRESQKPEVINAMKNLHKDAADSVASSLGIEPGEVAHYSESDAGHDLLDTFKKEYNDKYEPIAAKLQARDAEAAGIAIPDDERMAQFGRIMDKAITEHSPNGPYYKEYENYAQRLLDTDTVGKVDKLKTEINNRLRGMMGPGTDYNVKNALMDIKGSLSDFQESQIEKSVAGIAKPNTSKSPVREMYNKTLEESGDAEYQKLAKSLKEERMATNMQYSDFAKMSDELTNHLGVGDFRGAGTLKNKLTDKLSSEQVLNKFSIHGNSDFIPFLEKNFPETLSKVQENELKRLIRPAVLGAKDDLPLDVKKLSNIIDKHMAGKSDYIKAILPPDALKKIQSAGALIDALPGFKSSGTAGWMSKLASNVPQSGTAAVSLMLGHNPIGGYVLGHMGKLLAKDAPEAIKLSMLKFLGSEQPVKSEGMKSMVDFIHNAYKGDNIILKATKNVFKPGVQVLTDKMMPAQADRDKLDKVITKYQDRPDELLLQSNGHLGHYMPDHQMALAQSSTQALKYLQGIKPQPHILGPLDKPVPPQPSEIARYNRALDIATQPAVVMHHVKQGTLQPSDIADLHGMYPALYSKMSNQLSQAMINKHSDDEAIPYKTRMGVSLFLGQPVDSTMTPQAIQAAQPMPKQSPQQSPQGKTRKGTTSLGKNNKSYMTPNQSAESDRSNRE